MNVQSKLKESIRSKQKPFLLLYIYALLLYSPLIFLRLTNQYDGLWNQDDYMAGEWELSNGRWFWPYLDHARFGISLDPLPNLLATAGFVGMVLLLARAMRLSWNKRTYLASMLFLASTGITCQLSFSYMSITFAFSAVMAVLGVNLVTLAAERRDQKYGIRSILIAGVVIAVSGHDGLLSGIPWTFLSDSTFLCDEKVDRGR